MQHLGARARSRSRAGPRPAPAGPRAAPGRRRRAGGQRLGQHLGHPLVAGDGPRHVPEHVPDQAQRPDQQGEQVDQADQGAGGDRPLLDPPDADDQQADGGQGGQGVEAGLEVGRDPGGLDAGVAQQLGLVGEAPALGLLGLEGLDDQGAVEALVGHRRHVAEALLAERGRVLHPPLEDQVEDQDGRDHEQAEGGQERVGQEQPDRGRPQHDQHPGGERQRRQDLGGGVQVALGPRQQLARRVLVVPGQRQPVVALDQAGRAGSPGRWRGPWWRRSGG